MASELNMHAAQVRDYEDQMARLSKEMLEVKKKYFTKKRHEQQQR